MTEVKVTPKEITEVTIKPDTSNLDAAIKKIKLATEYMEKASSLLNELASEEITIGINTNISKIPYDHT